MRVGKAVGQAVEEKALPWKPGSNDPAAEGDWKVMERGAKRLGRFAASRKPFPRPCTEAGKAPGIANPQYTACPPGWKKGKTG